GHLRYNDLLTQHYSTWLGCALGVTPDSPGHLRYNDLLTQHYSTWLGCALGVTPDSPVLPPHLRTTTLWPLNASDVTDVDYDITISDQNNAVHSFDDKEEIVLSLAFVMFLILRAGFGSDIKAVQKPISKPNTVTNSVIMISINSPKLARPANSGTNNLAPILFHSIHGENVRLSADSKGAQRHDSYCKGICFSDRAIRVNEKVCIKFTDISQRWKGAIRFGFTATDPINYSRSSLPKYACPDLTGKPGNWAEALGERFAVRDVLFFYATETGDVHYGVNGEDRGIFFSGVDTDCPLWALIDIYGNTVGIESVDPRQQVVNCRRNSSEVENNIPSYSTIDINRENREPLPQVYRDANFQSSSPKLNDTNSKSEPLNATGNKCNVCYEQPINSVLYMCGHVCRMCRMCRMCYEIAVKQWRGPGSGQCPKCRAGI
ncbi:unnamed protein product, partial [Medioppia subpectinata]